jgi:coenzyme F420-0:L-glutamate ligase/coenzyme F420-1:gamma-L-glutamate ligase
VRDAIQVIPVTGIGPIVPGDDLAEIITTAAPWLQDGDVLVVTSKIVSKAEGQLVEVPDSEPERNAARERILSEQTARPVARRGQTVIVATHHGFVMAAAGIDNSNVDPSQLVLLPKDPDASARAMRAALTERFGLSVAVIISDTMGRPWRNGLTDVALGVAGIEPIRDHRGEVDPYGNALHLTQMAVVDELCGAAELVKGKCDGVPVAVVRGYVHTPPAADGPGAQALIRDSASDLFSLGTAEARAVGLQDAAALVDALAFADEVPDPAVIRQALDGLDLASSTAVEFVDGSHSSEQERSVTSLSFGRTPTLLVRSVGDDPRQLVRLGIDVHRLRCALAAAGFATRVQVDARDTVTIIVGVGELGSAS